MKHVILSILTVLGLSGCANYQSRSDWKNDRVGHRYATVVECNISNDAYVGKAKLWAGPNKGKVVDFYLKPYYKPVVPYTKETILLVEDK